MAPLGAIAQAFGTDKSSTSSGWLCLSQTFFLTCPFCLVNFSQEGRQGPHFFGLRNKWKGLPGVHLRIYKVNLHLSVKLSKEKLSKAHVAMSCLSLKRARNSCLVLLVLIKARCFLYQRHWLHYLRFVQDVLEQPVWRGKDCPVREGAKDRRFNAAGLELLGWL